MVNIYILKLIQYIYSQRNTNTKWAAVHGLSRPPYFRTDPNEIQLVCYGIAGAWTWSFSLRIKFTGGRLDAPAEKAVWFLSGSVRLKRNEGSQSPDQVEPGRLPGAEHGLADGMEVEAVIEIRTVLGKAW